MSVFERNVKGMTEKLKNATVGIAGCGGLGSNAAVALVRSGVGNLIIADFDKVELSNLNRQYYFLSDVGKNKTDALKKHLLNINPQLNLNVYNKKITPENIKIFDKADVLIEAFDKNSQKQMLIEEWCLITNKPIVCGSGLSGYSDISSIKVEKYDNIYICGEQKTDMAIGLSAPKVAIVANLQAAVTVEILMNK
jgi:sulfur carrier protein ThiS adenylyltransferase